jgi:hypothetical protein
MRIEQSPPSAHYIDGINGQLSRCQSHGRESKKFVRIIFQLLCRHPNITLDKEIEELTS